MKTTLLFLFLSLASTACTQQYLIADPTALAAKEAAEKTEPMILDAKEQRETALHEAGHAVIAAALIGPEHVTKIVVRTACCGGGLGDDAGHTGLDFNGARQNARLLRSMLATALAGRAADMEFLGEPMAGSSQDIKVANAVAWMFVNESGLLAEERGILVIVPQDDAPISVFNEINVELMKAGEHAKALVHANRGLIAELAEEILRQPVKEGMHTFDGERFRAFLKTRSLMVAVAPPVPPVAEGEEEHQ